MLLCENKGWNLILHRIWRGFIFWRGLVVIINLFWIPSGFSCFHSHIFQPSPWSGIIVGIFVQVWLDLIFWSLAWAPLRLSSPGLLFLHPAPLRLFLSVWSRLKMPFTRQWCGRAVGEEAWGGLEGFIALSRSVTIHPSFSLLCPCSPPPVVLPSALSAPSCDAMQTLCTLLVNLSSISKRIPSNSTTRGPTGDCDYLYTSQIHQILIKHFAPTPNCITGGIA